MEGFRKTAIIILTYNHLDYTKDCLESIRKYTTEGTYEIIVVDNCSTDGTREWLKEQPDIKLRLNDTNAGFPADCNIGIGMADPESDILLLNNDTVVTPRWLENLRTCLYSDPKIGAAGAVCNHDENLQGANLSYSDFEEMQRLAEKNNRSDPARWEEKVFLIGFCILIKREVLNKIGLLDERYSPGYVEDNDLSLLILSAGYRLMLCHDCFIHHYFGSGFRKDLNQLYQVLRANREYFEKKWGFETWVFDDIKYASLRLLDEADKSKPINILELKCGIGQTLLKCKYLYPNAVLHGLESNPGMRAIAKHVAEVSDMPTGVFPLDYPEDYFDYILAGNCLETMDNPEAILRGLKKHLKKDGFIIAEVQNIMHYSVLRSLLGGKWRYAPQDILRRTNRSFYTLSDIEEMFLACEYKNPFIFHWYSVAGEEDIAFVHKLCEIGEEKRAYVYNTYLFSVRYQK